MCFMDFVVSCHNELTLDTYSSGLPVLQAPVGGSFRVVSNLFGKALGECVPSASPPLPYKYISTTRARSHEAVLIKDLPLPTPTRTWSLRTGGQRKTWAITTKADLKPLSGPRAFGHARWRKDWVKVPSELAQDHRSWSVSVRDGVNSIGNASSTCPLWMRYPGIVFKLIKLDMRTTKRWEMACLAELLIKVHRATNYGLQREFLAVYAEVSRYKLLYRYKYIACDLIWHAKNVEALFNSKVHSQG